MSLFTADALAAAPVRSILDPGKYLVTIIKAEQIVSEKKRTPGIALEVVVCPGNMIQQSGSDPVNHHSFPTMYSSLDPTKTGPFLSRIHGLADAANIDLSQFSGMDADTFTTQFLEMLIGREVVMTVAQRTYEGNLQEDIKGFSRPS